MTAPENATHHTKYITIIGGLTGIVGLAILGFAEQSPFTQPTIWLIGTLFITLILNFPVFYLTTEFFTAHVLVAFIALFFSPQLAIITTLSGVAIGGGLKVLSRPKRSFVNHSYFTNWRSLFFYLGALIIPLIGFNPIGSWASNQFSIPSEFGIAISVISYIALHSALILTEAHLRDPDIRQRTGDSFITYSLIQLGLTVLILIPGLFYKNISLPLFSLFSAGLTILEIIVSNSWMSRAQLYRRNQDLSLLSEISEIMRLTVDQDVLFKNIQDQITKLSGSNNFYIALYDQKNETIDFPIALANGEPQTWATRPLATNLTDQVIISGQAATISHVSEPQALNFGVPINNRAVHSWLCVPLKTAGQNLGCIAIYSLSPHIKFAVQDEHLLNAISSQISVALLNTQEFSKTKRLADQLEEDQSLQTEKLKFLGILGKQVSATLRSQDLYHLILEYALDYTNSPWGSILMLDTAKDLFDIKIHIGFELGFDRHTSVAGIAARVVENGVGEIVNDVTKDPDFFDVTQGSTRAQLTVPITYNNQKMGVLALEHPELNHFTKNHLEFVQQVADQAGLAMLNAILFDEAQRRYHDQAMLQFVSRRFIATTNLQEIHQIIAESMGAMFESPLTASYTFENNQYSFVASMLRTQDPPFIVPDLFTTDEISQLPILGTPNTQQPSLYNDFRLHENIYYDAKQEALLFYLSDNTQTMGLVLVAIPNNDMILRGQIQLANAILAQSIIAIQNAYLFSDAQQGRDRLAAVLNSVDDSVLMIDASGTITLANQPATHLTDTAINELLSTPFTDLPENTLETLGFTTTQAKTLLNSTPSDTRPKHIYPFKDQQLERAIAPVFDQRDEVLGWVIVVHNRTDEVKAAQSRQLITETIVHDLRSPIGAIRTTLELLDDAIDKTNPANLQTLEIGQRSIQRVLNLINSLLDISRLETGNMEIKPTSIRLAGVAELLIMELTPQATENKIELKTEFPTNLPPILADPQILTRIITNLIDNALKFSPDGSAIIVAAKEDGSGEFLQISVTDAGLGIPIKFRDAVFTRFSQIPEQRGRWRGTGLGLTFCKLAVEAHGGEIWVEAGPEERGSKFIFTLPIAN